MNKWRRHRKVIINDMNYIICHERKEDKYRDTIYETFVVSEHPIKPLEIEELRFTVTNTAEMYEIFLQKISSFSNGNYSLGDWIE